MKIQPIQPFIPTTLVLVALLLSTLNPQLSTVFAQGSLTPPGAPAPTMKTLTQIEPRTPISSVPVTISSPGSYYLTTNLTVTSGNFGVIINSGNVTLDLNGFVLQGVSGSYGGVIVNGTYTNITMGNGAITGWGESGVNAFNYGTSCNLVFEHLTVSANGGNGIATSAGSVVRDCCSISNASIGIYCTGGLISGCMSRNNGSYGIYANDCVVRDCQAESNSNSGIGVTYSTVRDCHVRNNALNGIYAVGSTVSGCYVSGNTRDGILVNGGDCQIIGNNCSSNNISGNVNDAGILIYYSNNRVEDNHVTGNGNSGIWVFNGGYHNNIIVKNTVIGTNNYSIPTGQISGPLITNTVSGVITNSNPWANFSF